MPKQPPQPDPLSLKELLFCFYCASGHSPAEAALRAGCPGEDAVGLLALPRIRRKITAYAKGAAKEALLRRQAVAGLVRLALGPINDALRLADQESPPSPGVLAALDLFNVCEIKYPKGGGCELKFADRLEPLKLLLSQTAPVEKSTGVGGFVQALNEGLRREQPVETGPPPDDAL